MDRRDFLKKAGIVASATMIAGGFELLNAAEQPKGDRIKESPEDLDAGLDRPLTAIVVGAGRRGSIFSDYAKTYPGSLKIIGVADINDFRCNSMADKHNVAKENRFGDWSEVFNKPKFADIYVITTPDNVHYDPCMKALATGYHVFLEKPVAQSEKECIDIYNQSKKYARIVGISHVLRYAPYFVEIKKIIKSGALGDIVSIQHMEAVSYLHMSHSYVRGNWKDSTKTTPILIAKSCHDMDIMRWLMDKPCKEVSAFGSLQFFRPENAPQGSAPRCSECTVERQCAFSAKKLYLENKARRYVFDLSGDEANQNAQVQEYLRTTDYGRCVFHSGNDQCDNYAMAMEFEGGATASFSLQGLATIGTRHTHIFGTKGDIKGDMFSFVHTNFLTRKKRFWDNKGITGGHGGGDPRLMRDFLRAVDKEDESLLSSSIEASMESHIMGFQAEVARKNHTTRKIKALEYQGKLAK